MATLRIAVRKFDPFESAIRRQAANFVSRGIRCNAICPGTVQTQSGYEKTRSDFIARRPIGRIGGPEEVVDLVGAKLGRTPQAAGAETGGSPGSRLVRHAS